MTTGNLLEEPLLRQVLQEDPDGNPFTPLLRPDQGFLPFLALVFFIAGNRDHRIVTLLLQ